MIRSGASGAGDQAVDAARDPLPSPLHGLGLWHI